MMIVCDMGETCFEIGQDDVMRKEYWMMMDDVLKNGMMRACLCVHVSGTCTRQ